MRKRADSLAGDYKSKIRYTAGPESSPAPRINQPLAPDLSGFVAGCEFTSIDESVSYFRFVMHELSATNSAVRAHRTRHLRAVGARAQVSSLVAHRLGARPVSRGYNLPDERPSKKKIIHVFEPDTNSVQEKLA
jgi:hypothetical protein